MPSDPGELATAVADALDVAFLVASALESVGADYFIGGSVASSLQGEPRATNDIDIVVSMLPALTDLLAKARSEAST